MLVKFLLLLTVARVSDAAGNCSALSDEISVVFDDQPTDVNGFDDAGSLVGIPSEYVDVDLNEFPPVVIDFIGTSDTGLDTADNVANSTTPSFRILKFNCFGLCLYFDITISGSDPEDTVVEVVENSVEFLL